MQLKSEASKTYLSFLWWVIEPTIFMGIYYLVFGIILQRGTEDFIPFLLIGLITWRWFSNSISSCSNSINGSMSLINQINFPKVILPSITLVVVAFKFFIIFALLLCFLWWYGFPITQAYVYLPLVLFVQHCINTACANLIALLVPFIPDVKEIIRPVLRIAFYLSGVIYAVDRLPTEYQVYFDYNPMSQIIKAYRDILMYATAPNLVELAKYLAFAMLAVVASHLMLRKFDPIFARVLIQR
ncbi:MULTISPECIES: ABC transporter permease [Pseudoalteromonas]|uniref:ABC transporter permease n=1 Tax=Pseudoalteromonas TaxID=53246 RepID=UPI0015834EA6|nr:MULTISPECIES: ABC transporter permease [Pseudoalteromonas]MDI4652855.1 ABC transporter permease [Pseudoalteromonas shioyasakiensis]NUJ39644.1 ABC transporter permease [Pseudoalteromonas sp. 0303]